MQDKTRVISRKLISIIAAAMFFMSAAIAIVIGINGYANLESITRSNLIRSAHVITRQIEEMAESSSEVLLSIDQQTEIKNLLVLLSTLGPFYFEEDFEGSEIEEADQIYSLQSQLVLGKLLSSVRLSQELDSITLYHNPVFTEDNSEAPAFSIKLEGDNLEMAQYQAKDRLSALSSSITDTDFMRHAALFNVSSIYELTLKDFLKNIEANISFATPEAPEVEVDKKVNRLIVVGGLPVIQTTSYIELSMSNPRTWGGESVNSFIIVLERVVDLNQLLRLKDLVNVDIVALIDDSVLVSTLDDTENFIRAREDGKVNNAGIDYFVASSKVAFTAGNDDLRELEILTLSPVSEVEELNFKLFMQVFMVIVLCTILVCALYYLIIARIINAPLSKLMRGVESLAQGELEHSIEVDTNDEIGLLAKAFNEMSADIHEKRKQLKESHDELESLLETQSKELESTQMQLIEAEKMSSLGELVAGVSHEVSTPIGICITSESFFRDEASLIEKKFNEGNMSRQDFTDFMKIALDNSDILSANLSRTAELIKNFKQVAVDQCIEDLRPFGVYGYIIDLLSTLKPRIKTLKHVIEVTGDERLVITTLPGAMAQIITNLVMNSIIHGFEEIDKGYISIDVSAKDNGVLLTYKDDGKGMSEESLKRIFDPFFTTRKGKGGTGLGMNIVYKLITDTLHGHIDCTSQLGQGVKFEIYIENQEL